MGVSRTDGTALLGRVPARGGEDLVLGFILLVGDEGGVGGMT